MAVVWKLRSFLKEHRVTPNALAEYVRGKLSKTAIYNLVSDKPPTGVHFETLDVLISALTSLTDQPVSLQDLMEYQPNPIAVLDWHFQIGYLGREPDSSL